MTSAPVSIWRGFAFENVSSKVAIHGTLITTFGLIQNEHSSAFSSVIVLDDLFKEG